MELFRVDAVVVSGDEEAPGEGGRHAQELIVYAASPTEARQAAETILVNERRRLEKVRAVEARGAPYVFLWRKPVSERAFQRYRERGVLHREPIITERGQGALPIFEAMAIGLDETQVTARLATLAAARRRYEYSLSVLAATGKAAEAEARTALRLHGVKVEVFLGVSPRSIGYWYHGHRGLAAAPARVIPLSLTPVKKRDS